jgi:dihydrofolate reductase/thymidylate synthase
MDINLIVCTDEKGGISKNGVIPWKIKEDYDYFRDVITRKTNNLPNIIVMGRKTYEQMGLVKGHINIIVSTTIKKIETTEKVYIVDQVEEIFKLIQDIYNLCGQVFVCGGGFIYDEFIHYHKINKINLKIYWNQIKNDYNCDNFINIEDLQNIINNYNNDLPLIKYIINALSVYDTVSNPHELHNIIMYTPQEHVDNLEEYKYLNIMGGLLDSGNLTEGRNGFTYSKFGEIIRFNLKNSYPLLTTKKMFFKGIFEELMFFIKGQTDSNILANNGVKIWEKNTTREFLDNMNLKYEIGDMGPMYGFQWRHFNATYNGMDKSYDEKGFDQLAYVLNELKTNPNSRRILMTTYNPAQASQGVLFPCHGISIQFQTRKINDVYSLNISQNQRSCDYFLGVPFNIASYALLNYMICHVLNNDPECKYKFEPGQLIMFLGDYHLYKVHTQQAQRQYLRNPYKFPTLNFKRSVENIEDFKLEDIEILGYECYPGIVAEMVA